MKRSFTLIIISILLLSLKSYTQNEGQLQGPLLSGTAPAFKAISTLGEVNFPDDYFGKWKILFSHPASFTPVCTSEMLALALIQDEFAQLKTSLVVVSTDRLNSHIEWVKSIEKIAEEQNTPVKIRFPLVSDNDLRISRSFGILQQGKETDIRGVFFIDPSDKIRAFFHYPDNVGRNMEEIKRTLIALQTSDRHDVKTPANWVPGSEVLMKSPANIQESEKLERRANPKFRKVAWYMWYRSL
ncbi:MAG: peroxiredoxin [Bacteroidia bacterium]|jgi:peroxiredoxin (alkyl hydroperoxide reductase subunit C)|nr:peroxiredoxin [Bacteroidia bacterium]